jgi:hypothetical protein
VVVPAVRRFPIGRLLTETIGHDDVPLLGTPHPTRCSDAIVIFREATMDDRRFDEFTKAFSTGVSRRTVVRGFVAGISGAALAALGRSAEAAPKTCTVGCAGLPGPRKAACKQACRECGGDFDRVCFEEGPFGPVNFVCCPEGTFCVGGTGACCPVGTEPCFGPDGVTCCPEGTFCDFETGACLPLTICPSGEPAENCAASVLTDCDPTGACGLVDDVDNGCTCIERICGAPCGSSADCGGGPCVEVPGCCPDTRFCAIPCGEGGAGAEATGWP